jgi:hypothetical protein
LIIFSVEKERKECLGKTCRIQRQRGKDNVSHIGNREAKEVGSMWGSEEI